MREIVRSIKSICSGRELARCPLDQANPKGYLKTKGESIIAVNTQIHCGDLSVTVMVLEHILAAEWKYTEEIGSYM